MPGAWSAFDTAREGCREGKFDYLTVLVAQRTLVEARTECIDALTSYYEARADLDRLIGRPPS